MGGCGINFCKNEIFFTHNGLYKGPAFTDIPIRDYYATVSMHSINEELVFNFGVLDFKFDYKKMNEEEIARMSKEIMSEVIHPFDVHQIVYSYLVHNCYP